MSARPVEAAEPDPSATSVPNDEPVKENNNAPDSADKATEIPSETVKATNGSAESKEDVVETKPAEESVEKEEDSPRTQRRQYDNSRKNNSKYDPSILETTDDHAKIRAQVEFYFSDTNLPTDNHMWGLTDGSTNLPVSIKKLCLFGRMKRFQPYSEIVAALRKSHFLEVTGADGQEEVKRKVAYDPTIPRNKIEPRSVYVKGFGDEEPSSQFDIEAFFAPYGPTNAVRLRRTDDKLFKGSVFVEFVDEETAKKFLALEPKPLWKGKHELDIKSKKEYTDMKMQEIKDGKIEPRESWVPRGRGRGRGRGNFRGRDRDNRDRGRDKRDRGDRDPDDWKKRREDDRASGFKDDKRRNDNRGGKGNQRGGRRGGRDDRGPRSDRNREREEEQNDNEPEAKGEKAASPVQNEKKRAREDDDGNEAPAKKVDTKSEVAADAS